MHAPFVPPPSLSRAAKCSAGDGHKGVLSGRDYLMAIAWRDFLSYAHQEPQMVAAFNKATGRHYQVPGVTPSDAQLHDDAAAFVLWVTREHWGMDCAPASYRAEQEVVA